MPVGHVRALHDRGSGWTPPATMRPPARSTPRGRARSVVGGGSAPRGLGRASALGLPLGESWTPSGWRRPDPPLANAPAKTCSESKPRQHGVPDGEHCHFLIVSPAPDGRRRTRAASPRQSERRRPRLCGDSRSRRQHRISALARAGDHNFAGHPRSADEREELDPPIGRSPEGS